MPRKKRTSASVPDSTPPPSREMSSSPSPPLAQVMKRRRAASKGAGHIDTSRPSAASINTSASLSISGPKAPSKKSWSLPRSLPSSPPRKVDRARTPVEDPEEGEIVEDSEPELVPESIVIYDDESDEKEDGEVVVVVSEEDEEMRGEEGETMAVELEKEQPAEDRKSEVGMDVDVEGVEGTDGVDVVGGIEEVNGVDEVIDLDAVDEMAVDGPQTITEEEYDIQQHKQITAKRNFDRVVFGEWQIKTWYFSPYPLSEHEPDEPPETRIAGVARATFRTHGRTLDLLAGGLGRDHATGEKSVLWVCDRCFKYMADGTSWEGHMRRCTMKHPPGRKVYQRGAHIIWEVDGAKEKLYCQNLSLFGKLFIDIKTLFFDCDNFMFYLLTDADSQRDHVLGFFSKEKVSYDDYNLACIIAFPPYQRKGYGMLMIEFSYELSRRAGRVGTPERPLSDLGLRSYLTFWVSTLIRFFRNMLSVLPPDRPYIVSPNNPPDFASLRTSSSDSNVTRKRKKAKGWDGEVHATVHEDPQSVERDKNKTRKGEVRRTFETWANPDGSATTHVVVRCTLADIASATHLRIEDAAFALNECGLLMKRYAGEAAIATGTTNGAKLNGSSRGRSTQSPEKDGSSGSTEVDDDDSQTVVITREMVEKVATERGLKRMFLDANCVLL